MKLSSVGQADSTSDNQVKTVASENTACLQDRADKSQEKDVRDNPIISHIAPSSPGPDNPERPVKPRP